MMDYRDNVCVVLQRGGGGKVLVCHRAGLEPGRGWQFPQGGIDTTKDLVGEAKRELREEIGTDGIAVVSVTPETYIYDFPEHLETEKKRAFRGQRQRWVLAELLVADDVIDLRGNPPEFDAFEWVSPREALERIVDFKRSVYAQALRDLGLVQADRPKQRKHAISRE